MDRGRPVVLKAPGMLDETTDNPIAYCVETDGMLSVARIDFKTRYIMITCI
jgi:hypothetical protein